MSDQRHPLNIKRQTRKRTAPGSTAHRGTDRLFTQAACACVYHGFPGTAAHTDRKVGVLPSALLTVGLVFICVWMMKEVFQAWAACEDHAATGYPSIDLKVDLYPGRAAILSPEPPAFRQSFTNEKPKALGLLL